MAKPLMTPRPIFAYSQSMKPADNEGLLFRNVGTTSMAAGKENGRDAERVEREHGHARTGEVDVGESRRRH